MLILTNLIGFAGGDSGPSIVTRTFAGSAANGSDLSSYTFTAHSVSAVGAGRRVVVAGVGRQGVAAQITGVTVDGVAATSHVSTGAGTSHASIWSAAFNTSDLVADIVVTWSGTSVRCAIAVWAMYGSAATASATATDTAIPFSQSLTIPAGGVAFGCGTSSDNISGTWTNLTEDVDTLYPDASQWYSMASKQSLAGETSTISVASPTDGAFCLAAFGP